MLKLALTTEDSMVIDDYYKEGRGINLQLVKIQEARVRNIKTLLNISGADVALRFVDGQPQSGEALRLEFHHATLERFDFQMLLARDAGGVYRGVAPDAIHGKWRVTLYPMDERWKVRQSFTLPRTGDMIFEP